MLLKRLDPLDPRQPFSCADADLDEFYLRDSIDGGHELMAVTYTMEDENSGEILAFFCVSNDAIKKELVQSTYRRLTRALPQRKRYASMPAVKIGRLGVSSTSQGNGVGKMVLDFIKGWFTEGNKTGCRFITVDAYNTPQVISFYRRNGFDFLTEEKVDKFGNAPKTRIMYFDLIKFRDSVAPLNEAR